MRKKPSIPSETTENWQRVVDLMAEITKTPAGLVMQLDDQKSISVFVASNNEENVWKAGDQCPFEPGVYCETVIRSGELLMVPDALQDKKWATNPDLELGMTFYLGFPLLWPDGEVFGTICVLDNNRDNNAEQCSKLIEQFKKVVESDLTLLLEAEERKQLTNALTEIKRELEARVESRTKRLEEVNTALKVLLNEYEQSKKEVESSVIANVNELIIPNLHKAKRSHSDTKRNHHLDLVESGLRDVTSSFTGDLLQNCSDLTATEIQVANLIRQGKRTKEIASCLHTAKSTIDYHRSNIRKKLGLSNKPTSLNSRLAARSR